MKPSSLPITDRARRALARADNERARLGAPSLTPHHVLWALFLENGSVSSSILRYLGFDPAVLVRRLGSEWHATGPARPSFGEVTLCARATDVAAGLGHSCVDTAHLLLAVVNEESRATRLMRGVGVTFAAAQQATAEFWARAVG
jgi:ATP-dependent Clp protease ATP-binding subunit ClpA